MTIATTYENYSFKWFTPPEWWEWLRELLGPEEIFDPCPEDPGDFDGLRDPWPKDRPVYLNIPGGHNAPRTWWNTAVNRLLIDHTHGGWYWESYWAWCFFNCEQPRYLDPHPRTIPGFMVEPRERVPFIWGGPDLYKVPGQKKLQPWTSEVDPIPGTWKLQRKHGEPAKSPGNYTMFWTNHHRMVPPPGDCIITRTGV